jgi:hypothetical protein
MALDIGPFMPYSNYIDKATESSMIQKQMPVLNQAGELAGWATMTAHKKAAALIGAASVQQGFRQVSGVNRLCWIPVVRRAS